MEELLPDAPMSICVWIIKNLKINQFPMKKSLVFIAVLGTILLSACGFDQTFKDEPELTAEKGVLSEQKTNDDYSGTHLLTQNEEVLPLRSVRINLSGNKYLGNKVEVMGVMNEDDGVFEVTGITVLEKMSEDEKDESVVREFIEYSNSDLGFRINYYSDWDVENMEDGHLAMPMVVFVAPGEHEDQEGDKVYITHNPFNYSPTEVDEDATMPLVSYFQTHHPEEGDINNRIRKIGPDSLNAVKIEDGFGKVEYYLYRNGFMYTVSFVPSEDNHLAENENIFNEMMSEFRFTGFTVEDNGQEDNSDVEADNSVSEIEDNSGFYDISNGQQPTQPDETRPSQPEASITPPTDIELAYFESGPFSFKSGYPKNWYYAGTQSSKPNVLYSYEMSDEEVEDNNVLIALDVYTGSVPSGNVQQLGDKHLTIVSNSDEYAVYVSIDNKNYRVTGKPQYQNTILAVAYSIDLAEDDDE